LTAFAGAQYTSEECPSRSGRTACGVKDPMTFARRPAYNWPLLALLTLTGTFVAAVPVSCMPALFKEISDDLDLSLVEVGTVWGISSLAGVFVSIIAGVLSDRFGLKRILVIFCVLVGVTGALRGLSNSFFTLMFTVFLNGVVRLVVPVTVTKAVGTWFGGPRLGTAMGISAMGMGLGLTLGPMVSASVLSPLLGGWRNVLYLYGVVAVVMGLVWAIFGSEPPVAAAAGPPRITSVRQTLSRLANMKAIWLISIGLLFRVGSIMGFTGYLPLYLRGRGWEAAAADGTLAAFYAVSTLMVVPLSLISDRLRSRKAILIPAAVLTTISVSLMPLAGGGAAVWFLVVAAGLFMDGFMAVIVVMLLETEGIGPAFSGTALGVIFTIAQVGSVISPPVGNSFAAIGPGAPFYFWAGLSLLSLLVLAAARETAGRRAVP
jgi:MFS family permease